MTIPVQAPPRKRNVRRPLLVGVAGVALAAVAAGVWRAGDDDEPPLPMPSPSVDRGLATAEQATALLYYDWVRGRHIADCFTAAGFEREPFLSDELGRVPRVAGALEIEAQTTDPDLPTPDLRWEATSGPGDPESPPSVRLTDPSAPDNCLPDAPVLRPAPGETDASIADRAVEDGDFLTALGEYAWAAQNPGAMQLATARVNDPDGVTTDDARAQRAWNARLRAALVPLEGDLLITDVEVTDQYGQAAGVTELGDGAIVRVSAPGFALADGWAVTAQQECGAVVLVAGVTEHRGSLLYGSDGLASACAVLAQESAGPGVTAEPSPGG